MSAILAYAAAPLFAVMAVVTALGGGDGHMAALCMGQGSSLSSHLGGMPAMYLLMALVHAAPWLKLWARRAGGGRHIA